VIYRICELRGFECKHQTLAYHIHVTRRVNNGGEIREESRE
jgi:hypothetical protein